VKKFYNKSYKTWRKKLKKTLEEGKTSHVHGLAELRLWKWLATENNLQIQCNPHKNPNVIFLHGSMNDPELPKWSWAQRAIPDFKLYYRAILTKTAQYRTNRHEDWWNRRSRCYSHLISNKGTKNVHWWKGGVFKSVVEKTGYPQKTETRSLSTCTKINSKWIEDLNVRSETSK
jgi:hypothetical protein